MHAEMEPLVGGRDFFGIGRGPVNHSQNPCYWMVHVRMAFPQTGNG